MKYKIGDHVVIKESNIEGMEKFAGRTGVITRINRTPIDHPYFIDVDNWGDEGEGVWCSVKCLVKEVKENKDMKCKFKVGDKVRIVRNTGNMVAKNKYIGQVHTILNIEPNREFGYCLKDCNGWAWKEDDLEPEVCQDKIVITTDGKTTTATLYHDNQKTIATARCAPEDTFDFNVGAKLAMERLMKETEKPEPPKYYNGKVVCTDNCRNIHTYTVGKIYEFVDGTFKCDCGEYVHEFDTANGRFKSFNDWTRFSSAKWLEIKE